MATLFVRKKDTSRGKHEICNCNGNEWWWKEYCS